MRTVAPIPNNLKLENTKLASLEKNLIDKDIQLNSLNQQVEQIGSFKLKLASTEKELETSRAQASKLESAQKELRDTQQRVAQLQGENQKLSSSKTDLDNKNCPDCNKLEITFDIIVLNV